MTAIATRIGIKDQQGSGLVTQISRRLGDPRSILVLDSCKHIHDGVTDVIAQLLLQYRRVVGLPGVFSFGMAPTLVLASQREA